VDDLRLGFLDMDSKIEACSSTFWLVWCGSVGRSDVEAASLDVRDRRP